MKNLGTALILVLSTHGFAATKPLSGVDQWVWEINDATQSVLDHRAQQLRRAPPTATTVYLSHQSMLVLVSPLADTESKPQDMPSSTMAHTVNPPRAEDQQAARNLAHAERSLIEKEKSIEKILLTSSEQEREILEQHLADNRQALEKISSQRDSIKKSSNQLTSIDGRASFYEAMPGEIIEQICRRLSNTQSHQSLDTLTLVLQAGGTQMPQGYATEAWRLNKTALETCINGDENIEKILTDGLNYQY